MLSKASNDAAIIYRVFKQEMIFLKYSRNICFKLKTLKSISILHGSNVKVIFYVNTANMSQI